MENILNRNAELNFTPFPILTTERLELRRLDKDDAYQIQQLRSDTHVNEFIGRTSAISIQEAGLFIEKINKAVNNNESIYWAIMERGDRSLIGTVCLWNFSTDKQMAEIGYELLPSYQGKGIMQEAVSKLSHLLLKN